MLAMVIAQTPAPIPVEWQSGLINLLLFVLVVLNIWDKTRKKPPIEEIVDKKIQAQSEQTERKIDALDRRREAGDKENSELIHREIGDMKTFISDRINENRNINTERFGEMFGKIDSLNVSFQGLSNDLFHAVGKLEGQVTLVTNVPATPTGPRKR
jgi:hypothetical protein